MLDSNNHLHREASIFIARTRHLSANRALEAEFLAEEVSNPSGPGIRDAVMLTVGNWLVRLGNHLRTRSVYSNLSGKQA